MVWSVAVLCGGALAAVVMEGAVFVMAICGSHSHGTLHLCFLLPDPSLAAGWSVTGNDGCVGGGGGVGGGEEMDKFIYVCGGLR